MYALSRNRGPLYGLTAGMDELFRVFLEGSTERLWKTWTTCMSELPEQTETQDIEF